MVVLLLACCLLRLLHVLINNFRFLVELFNFRLAKSLSDNPYKDLPGKKARKGPRWLLLKNPENLSVSKNEEAKLKEALKMNEPLALAGYMKENLRQFREQPDREAAAKVINDWIERAQESGIRRFTQNGGNSGHVQIWYPELVRSPHFIRAS